MPPPSEGSPPEVGDDHDPAEMAQDGEPTEIRTREPRAPLGLLVVTHSEIGLVRKNNQDSGFASPQLLLVADGMGGAAAGDLASAVAVDTISRIDTPATGEEMLELLAGAIHRANDRIADLVEEDPTLEGMGTTVTGALFDGSELGMAHIGDSRAYLLRDGELRRLTHDHSWVQSLVDDGKISEAEAAVHPHRSLLLRVLNGQVTSEPDMSLVPVWAGDRLLFCSDGLCGLVDDAEIAATLAEPDLQIVLGRLVELAHEAGGIDNITIILADVVVDGGTADRTLLGAAAERNVPPAGHQGHRRHRGHPTPRAGRRAGPADRRADHGRRGRGPLRPPRAAPPARMETDPADRRDRARTGRGPDGCLFLDPHPVLRRGLRRPGRDLPGHLRVHSGDPVVQRLRDPADRGRRSAAVLPGAGPDDHRRRQSGRREDHRPGTPRRGEALPGTETDNSERLAEPAHHQPLQPWKDSEAR